MSITKYGQVSAIKCNKIPECSDLSDECDPSCGDPLPGYCNGICNWFFRLGDRYCDGENDPAWIYLKNSDCPEGFDEKIEDCTERFYCKAGNLISIPIDKVNDGNRNCDDGSDEPQSIFSSDEEMIRSDAIRVTIWIIALVTSFGNIYVILITTRILREKFLHKMLRINHILILNLSVADLIMGVYLLVISIQSVRFSGFYENFDLRWRSSSLCSAAGSLAIISSQASCFIMTIISTFRLVNLLRPLKSLTDPTKPWLFGVVFAWLLAIILAIVPLLPQLEDTFRYQLWFDSPYAQNKFLLKEHTVMILHNYIRVRIFAFSNYNITIPKTLDSWHNILVELHQKFPNITSHTVNFYGETSVCMPRFYVDNTDPIAGYSLFIITLNFISFIYVCVSYVFVYRITSSRPISTKQVDVQNQKLQARITRLLVTDFVCWIPICLIAFVKFATNAELPVNLYAATIAFLLPINSTLNPILFSPIFEKLFQTCMSKINR